MIGFRITNIDNLENGWKQIQLSKLYEYYRIPDTSWVSIMMERIYFNHSDIDDIASEYNVIFEDGGASNNVVTQAGITTDNKYIIYLSNLAINSILRNQNRSFITSEIEKFIIHENVHLQQNQLNNNSQPYSSDVSTKEKFHKYLSQKIEIDAFARQVAKNIEDNYGNEPDLNLIKSFDLTTISENLIREYHDIGGDALTKFIKEIYDYFYSGPSKDDPLEYKQWLKGHI